MNPADVVAKSTTVLPADQHPPVTLRRLLATLGPRVLRRVAGAELFNAENRRLLCREHRTAPEVVVIDP